MATLWTSVKWIKIRILCVSGGLLLLLGLILFRSYQLHILGNARVHDLAARQYKAYLHHYPKRGTIYDRNGRELAVDIPVVSIGVHPRQIEEGEGVASKLGPVLDREAPDLLSKIKSGKKFEWIARRVSVETGEKISALKLNGVVVIPESRRFYPNKELGGHLLGAVGYDAKPLGGLELTLNSFLISTPSQLFAEKDARGRVYTSVENAESFHDVTLTLDVNLQYMAERHLWENAQKYHVKSGFAIVLDPETGAILAMANYPPFNPNVYWNHPPEEWKNHALVDSFEPGSTFKTVLAAAALESGKVKPTDRFDCENGEFKVGKRIVHDHDPYGVLTFHEILQKSSNIGMAKIAFKIGKEPFYETIKKLGFGEPIELGFPGEASGRVPDVSGWSDLELSNIAFGQGISMNGLQLARAYAVFANKGRMPIPHFVSKVVNSKGVTIFEKTAALSGSVFKESTIEEVTRLLELVTTNEGSGKLAQLDGYRVAGKTGTAQKVDPDTKSYKDGEYVSSFIGYVPANDPEFVIYVAYDSPKPQYYGGVVAAPVFREIARGALALKGIPPADEKKRDVARSR